MCIFSIHQPNDCYFCYYDKITAKLQNLVKKCFPWWLYKHDLYLDFPGRGETKIYPRVKVIFILTIFGMLSCMPEISRFMEALMYATYALRISVTYLLFLNQHVTNIFLRIYLINVRNIYDKLGVVPIIYFCLGG